MSEQLESLETPVGAPTEQPELAAVTEAAKQEQEQDQEKQRVGGFQRRIDKLTSEKYELKGQVRMLADRLADIERNIAQRSSESKTKPEADNDPRPNKDNYSDWEKYNEDIAEWKSRQVLKKMLPEFLQQRESEYEKEDRDRQAEEIQDSYKQKVRQFAVEHDDWEDIVSQVRFSEKMAPIVEPEIMALEHGPDIAYYIGKHPELIERINTMRPGAAVAFLGRLEERLFPGDAEEKSEEAEADADETAPKPKPEVQAPKTIKPVKKPAPTATGLRDDEPIDKWMAKRNKETSGR